ncbi:hypothetical protein [Formivibrio citricus]|nr:hypothetical protein [Formivibrio citricus]
MTDQLKGNDSDYAAAAGEKKVAPRRDLKFTTGDTRSISLRGE